MKKIFDIFICLTALIFVTAQGAHAHGSQDHTHHEITIAYDSDSRQLDMLKAPMRHKKDNMRNQDSAQEQLS